MALSVLPSSSSASSGVQATRAPEAPVIVPSPLVSHPGEGIDDAAERQHAPTPPRSPAAHPQPYVLADADGLSVHFTADALQSRIDLAQPWVLTLDYVRTMAGFLLFQPAPGRIAMVGLGGGSLVHFCRRHLPASRMTVAEINPHVIALRDAVGLPPDDAHLAIIEADGAAFVAAHAGQVDVLLVDGFDAGGQPPALATQDFYDACHDALAPGGLLVVNLHRDDANAPLYAGRIRRSFAGNAVEVDAEEEGNVIVFASRGEPISPRRLQTQAALAVLDGPARRQLRPEFARIGWGVRDLLAGAGDPLV